MNKDSHTDLNVSNISLYRIFKSLTIKEGVGVVTLLIGLMFGAYKFGVNTGKNSSMIKIEKIPSLNKEKSLKKIIMYAELKGEVFDENGAEEDINVLLDDKLKTNAYTWKKKCEQEINYHANYFFEKKQYKDKRAIDMINICKKAKELNPKIFKYNYFLIIAYHKNKNYEKTVLLLNELARSGYAVAQRKMGIISILGNLVEKDVVKGKEWILKAAENGDKASQVLVDEMFEFL